MTMNITATIYSDGHAITGRVYNVRPNGETCIETELGQLYSGPTHPTRSITADPLATGNPLSRYARLYGKTAAQRDLTTDFYA